MLSAATKSKLATATNEESCNVVDDDPFEILKELENAPRPKPNKRSQIADFYRGRCVLITGASGFIGKVLIEKLLRTCPLVERIYVLIRPKWNKKPHERLRELLDNRLFDAMRQDCADFESRIVVVEGDVTQINLGLNMSDLARITKEVSVIFHSAATVKFDEPLKQSIAINITGTKHMISICRRCPKLTALVHVSTAYANCERFTIDEHVYPVEMDPERLISMADWLDLDTLQELKRRLLGPKPNTYTYTKAVAEWLLAKSARDLPVVVCRPSIVVASADEPFKGWIDNVNGPTGVVLGAGKGLVRSMYAEKDFVSDLVPVDKVISLLVALGWFAHVNSKQQRKELRKQQSEQRKQLLNSSVADSLSSDSLLVSSASSGACSSGSNSSAASTSGADDSLDDVHDNVLDQHQHEALHVAAAVQQQINQAQRHLRDARRNNNNNNSLHNGADDKMNSVDNALEEEESVDLSLRSDMSSASTASGHLFGETGTPTSRAISVRVAAEPQSSCGAQYSPLSSNSSHSSSASSSASLSPSSNRFNRRIHNEHCYGNMSDQLIGLSSRQRGGAGKRLAYGSNARQESLKSIIPTIREISQQQQQIQEHQQGQRESQQLDTIVDGVGSELASGDLANDNIPDKRMQQQQQHYTSGSNETLDLKLNQFREITRETLHKKGLPEELAQIPVFHCTSGTENPVTWGQVQVYVMTALALFPSILTYRYPNGSFTNNERLDKFYRITLHYLPAYIFDFLIKLFGGKSFIVKLYKKFDSAASVLRAFTSREWRFSPDNRLYLFNELMNDEDKRLFDCDIRSLDWNEYFVNYIIGVRKFLLKEPMSTLAKARKNLKRVYIRNLALQLLMIGGFAYYAATSLNLL